MQTDFMVLFAVAHSDEIITHKVFLSHMPCSVRFILHLWVQPNLHPVKLYLIVMMLWKDKAKDMVGAECFGVGRHWVSVIVVQNKTYK